ncbi:MAG: release factor glutamine methyltransferase [Candidatus Doudnabacteria bacterium Gr01-1014_77]|uniref:Release factor glutamine methyltransferase n=1 Tax=Candidatus Doudnabacteria bacterium Gr01-1014_77 TaxID=2017133 RepID=A0A554JA49_9BACT|nr:MAG: release factor glutamine methyltransferase [Candidatus Doudnabacteria bacterium Gr01-1014_77]
MREILISEILNKSKEYILAHPEIKLSSYQKKKLSKMETLIKKGFPLAYVLSYKWFYGYKIQVNKNVLIPRPETETLVDLAISWSSLNKPKTIIDIGTGSGAIIVSLKRNIKTKTQFYASDISKKALAVAKQNAKGLNIHFKHGNLCSPFSKILKKNPDKVLITANLPYLYPKQLLEKSIQKEPRLALIGGKKGFEKIEQLLKQISKLKLTNSLILLEINYDQAKKLSSVIHKLIPQAKTTIHKDLSLWDRIVEIRIR